MSLFWGTVYLQHQPSLLVLSLSLSFFYQRPVSLKGIGIQAETCICLLYTMFYKINGRRRRAWIRSHSQQQPEVLHSQGCAILIAFLKTHMTAVLQTSNLSVIQAGRKQSRKKKCHLDAEFSLAGNFYFPYLFILVSPLVFLLICLFSCKVTSF